MTGFDDNCLYILENVQRNYPRAEIAFRGDSGGDKLEETIRIPRGGVIGILGLSGCGKSTLLSLVSLMDRADEGKVIFRPSANDEDGLDFSELYQDSDRTAEVVRSSFGFVFQRSELLNHLSVEENLQLRARLSGAEYSRVELESALECVQLRSEAASRGASFLDKNPADLSVGEGARVGLVRGLLGTQKVILADEPTANVDFSAEVEILLRLASWAKEGEKDRTVLFSTHFVDVAWDHCDYFVVLNRETSGVVRVRQFHKPDSQLVTSWSKLVSGPEDIRKAIAETAPKQPGAVDSGAFPSAGREYSVIRAVANLLWRDFWKHPRSESRFLVERLSPLLYLASLFVLVWLGGWVLGLREGSALSHAERLNDEFLWTTEMQGPAEDVQQLSEGQGEGVALLTSIYGFHRWPTSVYGFGTQDYDDNRSRHLLIGRTIEADDPLLERIGETLEWPASTGERERSYWDFRSSGFGFILSADALRETLGYPEGLYPERIPVQLRKSWRLWVPVLAVAPQLPNSADYLLNTSMYEAIRQPDFGDWLDVDTFRVRLAPGALAADAQEQSEQRLERKIEGWLASAGVAYSESKWQTWQGERVLTVELAGARNQFELENTLESRKRPVGDSVRGVVFPTSMPAPPSARDVAYSRWSVGLPQDLDLVRELIRAAYALGIDVDTAVEARVASIHSSELIFESLAEILFFTVLALGMLLLLVSILFDSLGKVHTVGVMLGMGVTRRSLVLGYLLQSYVLIGLVLGGYLVLDVLGVHESSMHWLGELLFDSGHELRYASYSKQWSWFIAGLLAGVPAIVCLMRWRMYRASPKELLGS